MLTPRIDTDKCNACGLCVGICENDGLKICNQVVIFVGGACSWCGMCEAVCPEGAIGCPFDIILDES